MSTNVSGQMDPVYLETLYEQWKNDPSSLDDSWQIFFQGFDLASCPRTCVAVQQANNQSQVASLIYNYRDQGYRRANVNPLFEPPKEIPDLALEKFGFTESDLDRVFDTGHLGGPQRATLRDIIKILTQTYCGSIGVEYLHIHDVEIRRWLQSKMEPRRNQPSLDKEQKLEILELLVDAELFETFIQRHYLGQKRFSLEGGESLIPLLHAIVEEAPEFGVEEIVLGMAHRGRLNVLANLLDKSYATIFSEFEDNYLKGSVGGGSDVKYHKGYNSDHVNRHGNSVHLSLTPNPSHLEVVGPVVMGRARAKQRQRGDSDHRKKVIPVIVHGDSAFSGQGIVAETFNLSRLQGYEAGGAIHIVVNNQIGFTTSPGQAHSSAQTTDVAKMVDAPIFHVNGEDPEAVVHCAFLALQYRQEFGRDVLIDMVCYRKHGHSEGDEPAFTQPLLYQGIRKRIPVRQLYSSRLLESEVLTVEEESQKATDFQSRLEEALKQAKEERPEPPFVPFGGYWDGLEEPFFDKRVNTAVDHGLLLDVARGLTKIPEGFEVNSKISKFLPTRLKAIEEKSTIDWAFAEALAFGTLLLEGTPVRVSGQDSERGTFSHRHAVWTDMKTSQKYVPLNELSKDQAHFCVYNSPLSEASVLALDYGYSLSEPRMLILWEAQFGDFSNGAQVIIDQFIVSAHAKWQRSSGLVMLLPHGHEGQGPEHSNAYLERYLAACAENNVQVCYPSTPSQYFHVLRRQMKRPFRRPLIIMTPKSMLRNRAAMSPVEDMLSGQFQEILKDSDQSKETRRLIFCAGKIYYDLDGARKEQGITDVSLIRVEQLYPFPWKQIQKTVRENSNAKEIFWVQEEPQNRGAWTFMEPRLRSIFEGTRIHYVGRPASASPAKGSLRHHREEQKEIIDQALSGQASPNQVNSGKEGQMPGRTDK